MSAAVAELAVLFSADTKALEDGVKRATEKTGGLLDGLGKIGLAGLGFDAIKGAVSGVVSQFGDLIGAAEAAGDAKARLDSVLGSDLSGVVQDNATIANQLGMTKTAYLEAAGAASNYLVNLGLGKDAAAEMAVGMTDLAPKLAAFANADPSAVTEALQKGVAGSTKGLKDLGIAINDDLLKGLDGAAKSAEIFRQIQEQSAPASEAWADNQHDVAASMATVTAALDDAKAAIGEGLLPLVAPLAERFAALAQTLGPIGDIIKAAFGSDLDAARDAFAGLTDVIGGPLGQAIGAIAFAVGSLAGSFKAFVSGDATQGFADLTDVVMNVSDAISTLAGIDITAMRTFLFGEDMSGTTGAWAAVKDVIVTVVDAVKSAAAEFTAFVGGPGVLMQNIIGTVLVVAFGALAVAAGSAAAGVIAALAPILIPLAAIVVAVSVLRKAWENDWGGIREKTAAVVDWMTTNVGPAITAVVDAVKTVLSGLAAWWKENGDLIIGVVRGMWDVVAGAFQVAFATIRGLVTVFWRLIHGDFEGAGKALIGMWAGIGSGLLRAVKGAFGLIVNAIGAIVKNVVDAAVALGGAILDGLLSGLKAAPKAITDFLVGMAKGAVDAVKAAWGIHSPSTAFAYLTEQAVEGMKLGLRGMMEIGDWIQQTMVGWVKDKDLENFGSIGTLTKSLVDIFTNTTAALKALLSFDVSTSAAQISAQFDALVGTFQTALLRMKGLAQYAGRGKSPLDFLNMFDVQNIEIIKRGMDATIGLISGTLDIIDKLSKVKVPANTDALRDLFPFLAEIGHQAAEFIATVGKPEGEDATAFFQNGANTTAALASWAKAVADIVGIKFGSVAADFAAQMNAAADAARAAWDAVQATAIEWGRMLSMTRDQMVTGIQAYAAAVGAAVSILKGVAELKIDAATLATRSAMDAAARAAGDAVTAVAAFADWWIRNAEAAAKAVTGIKAYADAAGAAVGLLKTAGDLKFEDATRVTFDQLAAAADNARLAEVMLRGLAENYIALGSDWQEKVVPAMKAYADGAGAALKLLSDAAGLAADWNEAGVINHQQLTFALINAERARIAVQGIAEQWRGAASDEAMGATVAAVKGYVDAAGSALKLLTDAAKLGSEWNETGVITSQQLVYAVINAERARIAVQALATEWAKGLDDKGMKALNDAMKGWAESAGTAVKIFVDVSASLAKLGKDGATLLDPKQLDIAKENIRLVMAAMRDLVTGPDGLSSETAKLSADVATAAGTASEALGKVMDVILGAVASPFGRIKARGQRGDTLRANLAARIKDSLVAAVTAVQDAMSALPEISLPDGLTKQLQALGEAFGPLVELIGKLDSIKTGLRLVPQFAAAVALLTGAAQGGGGGGSATSGSGASGVQIVVEPTFMPMPVTMNNQFTAPISIGSRTIEAVAVEVVKQFDIDVKLKPTGP